MLWPQPPACPAVRGDTDAYCKGRAHLALPGACCRLPWCCVLTACRVLTACLQKLREGAGLF